MWIIECIQAFNELFIEYTGVEYMYKVKDAADQLGVTRVEVFEVLLSQREQFEPYVVKKNSITYISEDGMNLLREHFGLEVISVIKTPIEAEKASVEADVVINHPPKEEAASGYDSEWLKLPESKEFTPIETEDESIGKWLSEIQEDDELGLALDMKLKELRTQVTSMRNKLLVLDSEVKRKDEAIKHYHEIMKDDIQWLEDLERKLHVNLKFQMTKKHMVEIEEDQEEDDEKNNFFKFFKK